MSPQTGSHVYFRGGVDGNLSTSHPLSSGIETRNRFLQGVFIDKESVSLETSLYKVFVTEFIV